MKLTIRKTIFLEEIHYKHCQNAIEKLEEKIAMYITHKGPTAQT